MAQHVFISYGNRDSALAIQVLSTLEREGVRCWIAPRDVPVGVPWQISIVEAVRSSGLVVLILTASANASAHVVREIDIALEGGVPIIPVRFEDVSLTDELYYVLGTRVFVDALSGPNDESLSTIVGSVHAVLGREAGPPRDTSAAALLEHLYARSTADIVGASHRLQRVSAAAGPTMWGVIDAIERLAECSAFTDQYLVLQDPFRREESLESALRQLSAAQTDLLGGPDGGLVSGLREVAASWRAVLDDERAELRPVVEAARPILNPFVFGNPVVATTGNLFAGRRDVARQIEDTILGGLHVPTMLLYGQRRMGKTTILLQLPQLLGPHFLPIVIDCQNPAVTEDTAALLQYFSRGIANAVNRRVAAADKRPLVNALTTDVLRSNPFATFDDWISGVESVLPPGVRLLLCIDEYERLQDVLRAGWGATFLDALRHLHQHRSRFVTIFTGSHTFEELGPAWTDRFISARRLRVSFLSRDEVMPLLTAPISGFAMKYDLGAADAIYALTRGQPFLTQAVAFELVQLLNEEHRKLATRRDVERAGDRALESGGEYFANLWSDVGDEGQRCLLTLAAGRGKASTNTAVTSRLRSQDVLDASGHFAVPLVERWVATRPGSPAVVPADTGSTTHNGGAVRTWWRRLVGRPFR